MNKAELESTARALVPPGKGILAADESTGTIRKRFSTLGIPDTEENRRAYRELLFTTPSIEDHVSGVILFDETVRQSASDGTPFPALLAGKGILPGIKPDKGAKDMARHAGEKITEGLDGLRERLAEYRDMGARFGKWRAVITIGDGLPSRTCLEANAESLARYAALCQEQGLVPIVEPEVLMDGDHSLERCAEVTELTLRVVFARLTGHRVHLEGTILKPQYGDRWEGSSASDQRGRGRRSYGSHSSARRPGGGAWDRVPFRRAIPAPGYREPQCHERHLPRPTMGA